MGHHSLDNCKEFHSFDNYMGLDSCMEYRNFPRSQCCSIDPFFLAGILNFFLEFFTETEINWKFMLQKFTEIFFLKAFTRKNVATILTRVS